MSHPRRRVMIVEHEWDYGIRLADWLAAHGYQPVVVRSVDAAITELSDVRPHAIVLALGPCTAPRQIAATELLLLIETACPQLPVIMIAEASDAQRIPPVVRRTARRCLTKPLAFSEIGAVLQTELATAEFLPSVSERIGGSRRSIAR